MHAWRWEFKGPSLSSSPKSPVQWEILLNSSVLELISIITFYEAATPAPQNWPSLALDSRKLWLKTKEFVTICLGLWTSAFPRVTYHHYHQNSSYLRNNLLTSKAVSVRLQLGKQKPLYIFKCLVRGFNVGKSWITQTVATIMWVTFRESATSDLSLTHQSAILKSSPSSHFNSQDLLGRCCQLTSCEAVKQVDFKRLLGVAMNHISAYSSVPRCL